MAALQLAGERTGPDKERSTGLLASLSVPARVDNAGPVGRSILTACGALLESKPPQQAHLQARPGPVSASRGEGLVDPGADASWVWIHLADGKPESG